MAMGVQIAEEVSLVRTITLPGAMKFKMFARDIGHYSNIKIHI